MRKVEIYPDDRGGGTIPLPKGTRFVKKDGKIFIYFNPRLRMWYYVGRERGAWRVEHFTHDEVQGGCCNG